MNLLPGDSCPFPGQLPAGETADVWYGVWIKWVRLQLERDLICRSRPREMGGGALRAGGRMGRHKGLMGYPSLSAAPSPYQCVCVFNFPVHPSCQPAHTDRIRPGHDPSHANSVWPLFVCLQLSLSPFMHLCSSPPHTSPFTRCSFVPFRSHFSKDLFFFTCLA